MFYRNGRSCRGELTLAPVNVIVQLACSNKQKITDEIISESNNKDITRFISTHPDEDHIHGLKYLDDKIGILNFYCVKNEATKSDETEF